MARKSKRAVSSDEILKTALDLAEEAGWTSVRLRQIAGQLDCSLSDVALHYRDLDAIADAWFVQAWQAMLATMEPTFYDRPVKERLYILMTRWLDALGEHRQVSVAMLETKLYLGHPHHWVPMIFNLSRTVQWLRDAAGLDRGGRWRQVEEIGLTSLFLATLLKWCRDTSDGQEQTRRFLERSLSASDRLMAIPLTRHAK
ncbi:MAG: hypothetical protein R3245_02745 [Kiloniellales bacterium]|nr:hypothetical protein [Kiloniellales bacterium]